MTDERQRLHEAAFQFVLAAGRRGENLRDPEVLKRLKEEFAKRND